MGCHLAPIPPANLSQPEWTIRQGQAVWKNGEKRPEIAGEILLATKASGESFIQFTKTPFPLVIAQQAGNGWQAQFPTENKHYRGPGKPPARLIWFWISPGLKGKLSPKTWDWHENNNGWRLQNRKTGEWLEGYFEKPERTP